MHRPGEQQHRGAVHGEEPAVVTPIVSRWEERLASSGRPAGAARRPPRRPASRDDQGRGMVGTAVAHGASLGDRPGQTSGGVTLVTKPIATEGLFNGPKVATLVDALVNAFTSCCRARRRSVTAPDLY